MSIRCLHTARAWAPGTGEGTVPRSCSALASLTGGLSSGETRGSGQRLSIARWPTGQSPARDLRIGYCAGQGGLVSRDIDRTGGTV